MYLKVDKNNINFCHICPVPELNIVEKYNTHLVLAHLIEEDHSYADFYRELGENRGKDVTLIMDNSAFEKFKRKEPMFPTEQLVDLAREICADYVVMSDYHGEPGSKTIKAAEKMIPKLKKHGIGTFFCPQSEPGDIEDLMAGYAWGLSHPDIDYVAVSILNIPIAFGVESGNNLQRYTARWKWMKMLDERNLLNTDKKIQFLGMVDGPNEIDLVKDYHSVITTWDSSAAIWAGMNGIRFDNGPTGLMHGKFEDEVDFNKTFEHDTYRVDALHNMAVIDKMAQSHA